MDENQVVFSFEQMKGELQRLEMEYENFYSAINTLDVEVSQNLEVSPNSAAYGARGRKLYDAWANKCAPFKNFYYKFREWSSKVTQAFQKYADMQAEISGEGADKNKIDYEDIQREYDPDGTRNLNMDGTAASTARALAALKEGNVDIDGVPIQLTPAEGVTPGQPGEYYAEINGQKYPVTIDENNNITSVKVGDTTYHVSTDSIDQQAASIVETYKDNPEGLTHLKNELLASGDRELYNAISNQQTQATIVPVEQALSAALAEQGGVQINTNVDTNSANPGDQLYNSACDALSTCTDEAAQLYYAMNNGLLEEINSMRDQGPEGEAMADYALTILETSYNTSEAMRQQLEGDLSVHWYCSDGAIGNARETNNAHRVEGAYETGVQACEQRNEQLANITTVDEIDRVLESMGLPTVSSYCDGTTAYQNYQGYRENVERGRHV